MVGLGAISGSRFANTGLDLLLRYAVAGLGSFAVAITITSVFAAMVIGFLSLRVPDVVVSFSPGALDAMMMLALALQLDPIFVGAHHVARFLLISAALPLLFGCSRKSRRTRPSSARKSDQYRKTNSFGGERALERQSEPFPHIDQRFRQRVDHYVIMTG